MRYLLRDPGAAVARGMGTPGVPSRNSPRAAPRLQPTATEAGWGLRTRQEIVPLYGLRFTVDLTEGEMAVVSSTGTGSTESIGHRFFTSADGRTQLLVARLAGVPKSQRLHPRMADDDSN